MAQLKEESVLYRQLKEKYDTRSNKDITEAFFEECVELASEFSRRQIKFVMFKLSLENETGIELFDTVVNGITKTTGLFIGKNYETAFIMSVLETALEEK